MNAPHLCPCCRQPVAVEGELCEACAAELKGSASPGQGTLLKTTSPEEFERTVPQREAAEVVVEDQEDSGTRLLRTAKALGLFWIIAGCVWLLCGVPCSLRVIERASRSYYSYGYEELEAMIAFGAVALGVSHFFVGHKLMSGGHFAWKMARFAAGVVCGVLLLMCLTIVFIPIYAIAWVSADRGLLASRESERAKHPPA